MRVRRASCAAGPRTANGELPQTLGHEAAGVVDKLGEGVADVAVGDRVFGFSAEGRPKSLSGRECCPRSCVSGQSFPGQGWSLAASV